MATAHFSVSDLISSFYTYRFPGWFIALLPVCIHPWKNRIICDTYRILRYFILPYYFNKILFSSLIPERCKHAVVYFPPGLQNLKIKYMSTPSWFALMIICWMITYFESARLGFKYKTYAFPLWCVGLNVTWEFLSAVYAIRENQPIHVAAGSALCLILDILILVTYIKYGLKYWPQNLSSRFFYPHLGLVLIICMAFQYGMIKLFGLTDGIAYSGFLQNLVMSVLFIYMLVSRNGPEGQNMLIAVSKFIGTAVPTMIVGVIGIPAGSPNLLIRYVGLSIIILDVIYILGLYNAMRKTESKIFFIRWFDLINRRDPRAVHEKTITTSPVPQS
jgi:hypothetical protein